MSLHQFQLLLLERGVPLNHLGLRDIALEKSQALAAIDLLQDASRSILGGDVYLKRGDRIEVGYANWHSDPKPGEGHENFVLRSCAETRKYIEGFPPCDAVPLFVFVVGK
jgi:hypothetical protein